MSNNDGDLMLAYSDGDAAAFEQLYSRYKQPLYQYMMNSCESDATASELFQEVWVRVIKARGTFKNESPFNAWLFRIARNILIDHYRSKGRKPITDSLDEIESQNVTAIRSTSLTPEQMAELKQREGVLHEALQRLPDAQREAMLLKHIAGMNTAEIADVVETGAETIKSRLRYATSKLRMLLEDMS